MRLTNVSLILLVLSVRIRFPAFRLLLETGDLKILLRVLASRADLGGFFSLVDIAAVTALPIYFVIALEVIAILDHICQGSVAQVMLLFYFSNLGEGFSNLVVTLFFGNFSSVFVKQGKFLMLSGSSGFKVFPGGADRCGVIGIDMNDHCAKVADDVIIKNFGMFTFVVSRCLLYTSDAADE